MDRSSRSPPPPPLELGARYFPADAPATSSPGSIDSPPIFQSKRVNSYASTTTTNTGSIASPKRSGTSFGFIKSSPTVNVHTTCGRHTDQLLFGGPSLKGFAFALLGKNAKK